VEDIAALVVRQFRVYPPDLVPYNALNSGPGTEVFRKQFNFREVVTPDQAAGEMYFAGGMLLLPGIETPVVINYVQINTQRIITEVAGSTEEANVIFEAILASLTQFDPQHRLINASPLLQTHETQCVARLSVDWRDLLSDRLNQFLNSNAVTGIKSGSASSRLSAMNLRLTLQFDPADQRLREYGVIYADKSLILEPRQNTPFSERLYFTQSPLDSDSHLRLIEEFERSLSGAGRKRSKS
jgi:hypothetical protein